MSVTLNDVARIANVSPSTVSRVIADNPRISQETKDRVIKVMKELDYHPNIIARSLANKTTNIIGVILPNTAEKALSHPFYPEILRGIGSVAYKYKYNILLSNTNEADENEVINQFIKGGITDGIILMSSKVQDPYIDNLMKHNRPFVLVGRPEKENRINWVDNDNFYAAYEMTKYFIDRGHKRIVFYGHASDFVVSVDRLNGYKKALEDSNIKFDNNFVIEQRFIEKENLTTNISKLIEFENSPTAVIALDDFLAYELINFLTSIGLDVPGDISIAGFNNIYLSNYTMPTLTSVDVNAFELGVKAFEMLYSNIIRKDNTINRVIVPAKIIERNSIKTK